MGRAVGMLRSAALLFLGWAACSASSAIAQRPMGPPSPVAMIALPARPVILPAMSCEALRRHDFARAADAPAEILTAADVPATEGRPAYCRVTGYVTPQVQFELHLPTATYTGRYLQNGCGGNCGFIRLGLAPRCDNSQAESGAFATAATNAGHVGNSLWSRDNPGLVRDFAERGVHVTALAAKAIIAAFYGHAPRHSYFSGCSDGGREAIKEARRFPQDFDGIVAGSPATYVTSAFLRFIWQDRANLRADGSQILTDRAVATLHAAVLAECDAKDGLKDGQIDEPRACTLDPATIVCKPGQVEDCITADQAKTARAFYSGAVDETGTHYTTGGQPYGSELTWVAGSHRAETDAFFGDLVMGSANWRSVDLRFTRAEMEDIARHAALVEEHDADLTGLRDRGGKLLIWEGLADFAAGPRGTLHYYQQVREALGGTAKARDTVRFFRIPGVYHCGGGYLPYEENMLGALVAWVERGIAPDSVTAAVLLPDGSVRQRPIYAYPVRAKYTGRGDINRSESFTGVWPKRDPDDHFPWAGDLKAREDWLRSSTK